MIRLFEFAENKREIERQLSDKTDILVEHILYLIMDKNNSASNHWKQEIYSFIHSVKKLSGKNKFPTSKQIYGWTYDKISDCVTDTDWISVFVEDACDKECFENIYSITDISKRLHSFCTDYFTWLSESLSRIGIVSRQDVIHELDILISKYSI